MNVLPTCPVCGWASEEIRCPRCNALKLAGCSGSCLTCALGGGACAYEPEVSGGADASDEQSDSGDRADDADAGKLPDA